MVKRYENAWAIAEKAAQILKEKYGAQKVVAFGSLAKRSFFTHWSDIDLAVWGVPDEVFYAAVGFVTGLTMEFKIDLIDARGCQDSLRGAIEIEGVDEREVQMRTLKTVGDTVLREVAREVLRYEIGARQELINEMVKIMRENNGVGIAAPQIGISERIIVIEIEESERYPDKEKMSLTVMINPQIKILDPATNSEYEGCLSVPGIRGLVPRYNKIEVVYLNLNGQEERKILKDFSARVAQHEGDHLNGITFLERVTDPKSYMTDENYRKYLLHKGQSKNCETMPIR